MPTYPKWRLLMSVNLMLSKHIQTEQKNTRELVNIIWKLQSVSITYHFTLVCVAPCDGVSFVWWIKRNTDIPRARLELAPCALRRLACSLNSRLCDWLTDDDQEGVLDGLMEALQTGSAFRDPSRPARKKAGGRKGVLGFHYPRHETDIVVLSNGQYYWKGR